MRLNNQDIADRFARMWRDSRFDAGKSQAYMAKALGVSVTTVQNWECGFSCPSQEKGFEWFQALGTQPLPYYLKLLYPSFETLSAESSDDDIDDALMMLVSQLTAEQKRKLLYCMTGEHGSSPNAVLELTVAHLQTPLKDRLNIASNVITNYDVAEATGTIQRIDHIQPNMNLLRNAFFKGKQAVQQGFRSYTTLL